MALEPQKPGHYWYYQEHKEPIIIKVTQIPGREAWTVIDGYGHKVEHLPGRLGAVRIEDIAPPGK